MVEEFVEPEEFPFKCVDCDSAFAKEEFLVKHRIGAHLEITHDECVSIGLTTKSDLKMEKQS